MISIHSTAIVHPSASLGRNVIIGPYSIIGSNVNIGDYTTVGSNVVIAGRTVIGCNNQILSGCVLGSVPQDLRYKACELTGLYIGNNNLIRENVTVNRASGTGITYIGNNNLIMVNCHVAHDCQIRNNVIISNSVSLAGHVMIDSCVVVGGHVGLHQFVHVGALSMIAAMSKVEKNVLPFVVVSGMPATTRTINLVGLKRYGISKKDIDHIRLMLEGLKFQTPLCGTYLFFKKFKYENLLKKNAISQYFFNFLVNSCETRGFTSFKLLNR
nr:acyl-UDP-N-acetylglucosamine o-acyltransferase [Cyanidiaceae sp.]